jgi:hypothetical protein
MKKLFTLLVMTAMTLVVIAQSPQKMSYQFVVRDAGGVLKANQSVGIKISILQGSASGTVIYTETQTTTTNANGLVSIEIGGGTGFDAINWASGPYYMKTETDPSGGTSYTIVGTSQLLSVPYALYSNNAGAATETDPIFVASSAHGITGSNITNWNTAYGWGNHAGLYRPISWVPSWSDVTGKPAFATVATSGSYNDLSNKPTILNSQWITNGSNIYYSAGSVGIGMAPQDQKLEILGGTESYATFFNNTSGTTTEYDGLMIGTRAADNSAWFRNCENGADYFCTNNTTRLFIGADGRIGIGTEIPAGILNIKGNTNALYPTLLLTEIVDGYSRLTFKNTVNDTKNWTIAGWSTGSDNNSRLNFYYDNGVTGTNFMSIDGNGNVGIGTMTPGYKLTVNGTAWCSSGAWTGSDIRWKRNIKNLNNSLSDILELNAVSYDLKTDEFPEMGFETGKQIGLIAQDVEKIFPELVRTDNNGYKSVSYEKLSVLLVEGIKEQQKQIQDQQKEIDELKTLVKDLKSNQTDKGNR